MTLLTPLFISGTGPAGELEARAAQLALWGVDEAALFVARELVDLARLTADSAERAAAQALVWTLAVAESAGSTRLPLGGEQGTGLLEDLGARLGIGAALADGQRLAAEVRRARLLGDATPLDALLGLPGERKPLILDGHFLYSERTHRAERELAATLLARMAPGALMAAAPRVDSALPLNAEQARAVATVLRQPLTVVVGGPGTGKTTVVAALVEALRARGLARDDIALAAPTGRAADRLRQALARAGGEAPEAFTLHRLLGYQPRARRFAHHAANPLPQRAVIVDEASMLDLELARHLLAALAPETALVLLGDAEQLPSVGAGAVLRDLCPGEGEPGRAAEAGDPRGRVVVALHESFRMSPRDPDGRALLSAANAVRAGRVVVTSSPTEGAWCERLTPAEITLRGPELLVADDAAARARFLAWWAATLAAHAPERAELAARVYALAGGAVTAEAAPDAARLLDGFAAIRLLAARRRDAEHVNRQLHDAVIDAARRRAAGTFLGAELYPGEPVMVTQNDYARGLWNGDQGVIIRAGAGAGPDAGHRFYALFRQGEALVAHPLDSLRHELALAYAVTVHKSQGSEFDHVALLLPDEDTPLGTRELVYTAMTRARRGALVVGARALLVVAVGRAQRRFSGLASRLRRGAP